MENQNIKYHNDISSPYNSNCIYLDSTIHETFEQLAEESPDYIGVVFGDIALTYKEINDRANQLAWFLRDNGVQKGDIIAIMLKRSPELLITILAVLKAGAAYLPIELGCADYRVEFMLEDSNVKLIFTQKEIKNKFNLSFKQISIDNLRLSEYKKSNLGRTSIGTDLAYIIYTSASTGKPKGVMIEHKSVLNLANGVYEKLNLNKQMTVFFITNISFDMSITETLVSLVKGVKIAIASEEEQCVPRKILNAISKYNISLLETTPSRLRMIIDNEKNLEVLKNLSIIMIGGEELPPNLLKEIKELTNARIYNMYGPTETTVWSTAADLTNSDMIHIGKPICNTEVFILDKNEKIVPMGEIGEICIAGLGLARGYINNTKLNQDKFVYDSILNKLIYKTGDLARQLPNGDIEFHGRNDRQVKIRGHRIELGEIENNMLQYKSIKRAIVISKNDSNELFSFIVADSIIDIDDLTKFLLRNLNDIMIPSIIVQIDSVPLTANGKVDYNSLLEEISKKAKNQEVSVQENYKDIIESTLEQIVLKHGKIGSKNNTIDSKDKLKLLGLDSINFVRIVVEIEKAFGFEFDDDNLEMRTFSEFKNLVDYVRIRVNRIS